MRTWWTVLSSVAVIKTFGDLCSIRMFGKTPEKNVPWIYKCKWMDRKGVRIVPYSRSFSYTHLRFMFFSRSPLLPKRC
ncbi:hypothetical protein DL96DRAFT_1642377 [Flagelloscypha sp. PMI_526]|nr:hypothetical protein DL96DRAFT_1642377 [Flagelloscypha sp. PMI_526]